MCRAGPGASPVDHTDSRPAAATRKGPRDSGLFLRQRAEDMGPRGMPPALPGTARDRDSSSSATREGSAGKCRLAGLRRERIRRAVARPEAQGASAARVVPAKQGRRATPVSGDGGPGGGAFASVAREARRLSGRRRPASRHFPALPGTTTRDPVRRGGEAGRWR